MSGHRSPTTRRTLSQVILPGPAAVHRAAPFTDQVMGAQKGRGSFPRLCRRF